MLCIALLSCGKESDKSTWSSQESKIESFIKSQLSADSTRYLIVSGAGKRIVLTEGTGDSLRSGGSLTYYYAGYVFSGSSLTASNMFGSNRRETLEEAKWSLTDQDTTFMPLTSRLSDLVKGLSDGLKGVRAGEECIILFSGKYGFGDKAFGTIPAKSALAYHIWVESISNE